MSDVRFIRKNGRIIPIYKKGAHKKAAVSAVAVGSVVGLGAGAVMAKMLHLPKEFSSSMVPARLKRALMPTGVKLVGTKVSTARRLNFAFSALKDFARLNKSSLKTVGTVAGVSAAYGAVIGSTFSYADSLEQAKLKRMVKGK